MPNSSKYKIKVTKKGVGVYFDSTKVTSGQRFFENLYHKLSENKALSNDPNTILFNISAPITELLKAKLRRKKIVLRVDSLYFDKLSPAFIATFNPFFQKLFTVGVRFSNIHNALAFCANFINQNYAVYARIMLADMLIFQSKFSRKIYQKIIKNKENTVICNGATYLNYKKTVSSRSKNDLIKLVTIYDGWRPSKRVYDIVQFVKWANESRHTNIHLTILGYTSELPACVSSNIKDTIENSPFIKTLPSFKVFTDEIQKCLFESDIYITFTFKDACPNAVIEAMAHGLPVVCIKSGGLPDIVGDAGVLLSNDDFASGYFSDHRFACDFPSIDFHEVLEGIQLIMRDYNTYAKLVGARFETELSMEIIADKYMKAISNFN